MSHWQAVPRYSVVQFLGDSAVAQHLRGLLVQWCPSTDMDKARAIDHDEIARLRAQLADYEAAGIAAGLLAGETLSGLVCNLKLMVESREAQLAEQAETIQRLRALSERWRTVAQHESDQADEGWKDEHARQRVIGDMRRLRTCAADIDALLAGDVIPKDGGQ